MADPQSQLRLTHDRPISLGSIHPVRAHGMFIWLFVLSAALTALALTFVYGERYAAETNTYFKPAEVTRLSVQETRALGSPVPNTPFKVIGQTLDALVKSDALLRPVVQELGLDIEEPVDFGGPWYTSYYKRTKAWLQEYGNDAWSLLQFGRIIEQDRTARAIRELRRNTKVVSEDSYVFTLRTMAKTPELAARIANELAVRLIDVTVGEDQRASENRTKQLQVLRTAKLEEIAGLERQVRDLLGTVSSGSIAEEINSTITRLQQIDLQRADAQASLVQEDSRAGALASRLRQTQAFVAPLNDDDLRPARPTNRLNADDYARATTERISAESKAAGLRSRSDSLQREAVRVGERIRQLNAARAEHDLLTAQLQSAKRDLVALTDASQETAIKSSSTRSELWVQSRAQPPQAPVSPIKVYHVGLAAALAALFGMGMAVLLGYFNVHLLMVREKWRTLSLPPPGAADPAPLGQARLHVG